MIVASERVMVVAFGGAFGLVKAFAAFSRRAELSQRYASTRRFFRLHKLGIETQISVLYNLQETREVKEMQEHVKTLLTDHLADELRRRIREEIWSRHLLTMGLIRQMRAWHIDFLPELAQRVQEEVAAFRTILCKEGNPSICAYYVLSGRLSITSTSHYGRPIPEMTDGMWVGEAAFVSPHRRRAHTVRAQSLTRL